MIAETIAEVSDKMSKAVQQIEREVKTKGPFQGAGAHAMQQGVLLVPHVGSIVHAIQHL